MEGKNLLNQGFKNQLLQNFVDKVIMAALLPSNQLG